MSHFHPGLLREWQRLRSQKVFFSRISKGPRTKWSFFSFQKASKFKLVRWGSPCVPQLTPLPPSAARPVNTRLFRVVGIRTNWVDLVSVQCAEESSPGVITSECINRDRLSAPLMISYGWHTGTPWRVGVLLGNRYLTHYQFWILELRNSSLRSPPTLPGTPAWGPAPDVGFDELWQS